MSSADVPAVDTYTTGVRQLLERAQEIKEEASIEPPLNAADFIDQIEFITKARDPVFPQDRYTSHAVVETALRNTFYELLASTSIYDAAFSEVWNLLDIAAIISDNGLCEPGLPFWLVEELLDSQTIRGCQIIFDYLESRRERWIAKHFSSKHLIILRACNELLRRLSRAEDTVFCGRVFIFLFQSFPLGDKSSVNLRGEYHVDNITVYDEISKGQTLDTNVYKDVEMAESHSSQANDGSVGAASDPNNVSDRVTSQLKEIKFEAKVQGPDGAAMDMDELYPIFWSLQSYFSSPTKLFDPSNLASFKMGLAAALAKFREGYKESDGRGSSRSLEESKQGVKRKRGAGGESLASSFNPKYLTSRDLFDLEISDIAFQRHVLVQGLILTDFLLSLTPESKSRLENLKNKSVIYDFSLTEIDAQWASQMKTDIATYLQQGTEGKFYYRMVDTVLSRDKNWARWKAENCPPFQRPPMSAETFAEAKTGAQKACTNKRLRAVPLGSLDLKFLSDGEHADGLEKFQDPERYMVPAPDTFSGPIADDTFDMEMAKTDEDKELAANARHSKLWRTLRIASKSTGMLRRFDRIDDGHNLQALFEVPGDENAAKPAEADAGTKDPAQAPVSELSPPTGADPATVVEEGAS